MTIAILDRAEDDLFEGYLFFETQQLGLGAHFLECLYADIESLRRYAGIHRIVYFDYHRMLSKRFPFAVFYTVERDAIRVHAVVDCRRRPAWIRERLR